LIPYAPSSFPSLSRPLPFLFFFFNAPPTTEISTLSLHDALPIWTYGHRAGPDEPVEIVSLRVVGQGIPDRPRVPDVLRVDRSGPGSAGGSRRVYFGPDLGWRETPIIDRGDLVSRSAPGSPGQLRASGPGE